MESQEKQIKFRTTGTNKERIEAFARDQGLPIGEYLERAALELVPDPAVPDEVVPTPEEAGELHEQLRREVAGEEPVPIHDYDSRETYIRFLYERNTELHRDVQKRWPGVLARRKSASEWSKVKKGEPLEAIPQREGYELLRPTTYQTT